jgi:hypothetical protein
MGFFSEVDMQIQDMVKDGASFYEIKEAFPMLRDDQIEAYLGDDHDEPDYDDSMDGDAESALASAGWGTDEDYGYFGDEY